jgi:hypothetical protein
MKMDSYNTIKICAKPTTIAHAMIDEHIANVRKETALAYAAPELKEMLEQALFSLETVAHLRGMERELLPTIDATRARLEELGLAEEV